MCTSAFGAGVGASEGATNVPTQHGYEETGLGSSPTEPGVWQPALTCPSPPVQPRSSEDPTQLPGGCSRAALQGCETAQGPADHRRDAAGPTGLSHIWFSFECPNVIKFSTMQRKSLVRCGFLPFPSRLRNHSLSFHRRPTLLPATGPSYSAKAEACALMGFLELMRLGPIV